MTALFNAGEFCCAFNGCVLIYDAGNETWEKIPHTTEVSFNAQAQQNGLVTSSTGGEEQAFCGIVNTTGTLGIACHDGDTIGALCLNNNYSLRWAVDCDLIWNDTTGTAVAVPTAGTYYQALVKITSLPLNLNFSNNAVPTIVYQWKLVAWRETPDCQTATTV